MWSKWIYLHTQKIVEENSEQNQKNFLRKTKIYSYLKLNQEQNSLRLTQPRQSAWLSRVWTGHCAVQTYHSPWLPLIKNRSLELCVLLRHRAVLSIQHQHDEPLEKPREVAATGRAISEVLGWSQADLGYQPGPTDRWVTRTALSHRLSPVTGDDTTYLLGLLWELRNTK